MRRGLIALALLVTVPSLHAQQTRPERTGYLETSSSADVEAFVDSLIARFPGQLHRGEIGRTTEGRAIPYVIASRPLVRTPAEAQALNRPIVYVQGNIHAGEVEGKEALQALLRDLLGNAAPNALDSIVLIAVPNYNADGNEKWGPQARQRSEQNGPERVGQRPNAMNLDLNRDYIKAEAPETRGSLAMFAAWDPDVFVDLHTTNGSYHGYALTYSPSLHPTAMVKDATPIGPYTRDVLLPALRERMKKRHGLETFDYGNFSFEYGQDNPASVKKDGWWTYEHKGRFGTNYYGLRGRVSVLSEAYSHDPFERRIKSTYAFVYELLSFVGEQGRRIQALVREGNVTRRDVYNAALPLRAEIAKNGRVLPVLVEPLQPMDDTLRHETGVRRGFKRTNRFTEVMMPVYDRFDATMTTVLPEAWVLDSSLTQVVLQLRAHGVTVARLDKDWSGFGERFAVDSIIRSPRPFQGHHEVRLEGKWRRATLAVPAGSWLVPVNQHLSLLAAILLEPQSDDGLVTWNFFDSHLAVGSDFPVRRARVAIDAPAFLVR